jgi:ring-1,2-phenylacetyl-CoA epoxidase subunit PaaC
VIDVSDGSREYLLAFADDEHLIGQQHTEWIGTAPFLEEDLAFCSIAQDELGHAAALYDLLGDPDTLAFGRPSDAYRSCAFVELPFDEWDDAFARHWLYDLAERHRWSALAASTVPGLPEVAARCEREEEYHRRHAQVLLDRLRVSGARQRLDAAITRMLPLADALFEPVEGEPEALAEGVATVPSDELRRRWRADVERTTGHVDWDEMRYPDPTGRRQRSDAFEPLLARLTEVMRLDPTARW